MSSFSFHPYSATSALGNGLLGPSSEVAEGPVRYLESGAAGARENVSFLLIALPPWCSALTGLFL